MNTASVSLSSSIPSGSALPASADTTLPPLPTSPQNITPPSTPPVKPGACRRLHVRHTTNYAYDKPVERSLHRLHLRPMVDARQALVSHRLTWNPHSPASEYEDVFGNATTRFELSEPYSQLTIEAESIVELRDDDPFDFANAPIRPSFPLHWMPWELTMLTPYLTSGEAPEAQLHELFDYALSFVERNNRDLMETLFAINLTLFREYTYAPGSTSLKTTPYDVFTQRQGVCQDFSNLFICLARLLGIPARYVCGYVFCPATNTVQSQQSHAWVELYIPHVGWKGFDPTNGILPRLDHIRVAVGRHYRDTAPTAGTLYTSALETMQVHVAVSDLAAPA